MGCRVDHAHVVGHVWGEQASARGEHAALPALLQGSQRCADDVFGGPRPEASEADVDGCWSLLEELGQVSRRLPLFRATQEPVPRYGGRVVPV
jgi:hypothetical protein